MNLTRVLSLLGPLVLSACISLPEIEAPDATPPGEVAVRLITPAEPTVTNGKVELRVELSGPVPDTVQLLLDGALLSALAPPYTYSWDTAGVAEGSHAVTALAAQGGKVHTSDAQTVIVDRTAPQWVSQSPRPGASKVSVREPIAATFSEALKGDTVTAQRFRLKSSSEEVPTSLALSADGKTLTATPTSALAVDRNLELEVGAGVTDLAGNALPAPPQAWTWRVPAFVPMTGALKLGPVSSRTCDPALQLDPEGRPVVAWIEDAGASGKQIHVRRWESGTWKPLGDTFSLVTADSCSFELSASGLPVVAVNGADASTQGLYIRRWNGSTWENLGWGLNAYPGSTKTSLPRIHVSRAGTPFVAWLESNGTVAVLPVRRWNGSTWEALGAPLSSDPSTSDVFNFVFALDAAGNPFVFWAQYGGTASGTYAMRWTGTSWVPMTATSRIDPTLLRLFSVQLDPSDLPVLVGDVSEGESFSLHVRRWNGSVWEALGGTLSVCSSAPFSFWPSLVMGPTGRLTLGWDDESSGSLIQGWTGNAWASSGQAQGVVHFSLQLDAAGDPAFLRIEQALPDDFQISVQKFNR